MKKIVLLITSTVGLPLFFVSCDKNELSDDWWKPTDTPALEKLEKTVELPETRLSLTEAEMGNIACSNDFSFDFFRKDYDGKDKLLSPLGFQITLGMVGNLVDNYEDIAKLIGFGTEGNKGEVNEYFKHLIEALSGEKCNKELRLANAMMSDMRLEKFPETFLEVLPETYFADILKIEAKTLQEQPVGFRPEDIWCRNNTKGMINKAPFPIFEGQWSLLNALCFQGEWQNKFDKDSTITDDFHINSSEKTSLSMMRKQDNINYYKNDDFAAVSLPFGDGTYNLSILLPNVPFNLPGLLDKLDSKSWDTMRKGFVNQKVRLSIPVFSAEYSKQMVLFGLGMKGLVGENGSLIIGQSARFMMDEEGAAAAAVTQTINPTSTGRSSAPKVVSFIANSPFIYTITETGSGLILFMGTFSGM